MKKIISFIIGGLVLGISAAALAQTTFTVTATVPTGTGVGFTVSSVNSTTNVFTTQPAGTTSLNFGTLTLNSSGVFLPSSYFAIDVTVTGGSGSPDTTITYTEGSMPTGQTAGLGLKGTATFAKEIFTSSTTPPTETTLQTNKLADLSSTHIAYTSVQPGWLRVYLGISDGSASQPAGSQPFTQSDLSGTYTGTLTFTTVVN